MSCYLVAEGPTLILVREADTAIEAARLNWEARVLARAAHPGVVALAPGTVPEPGQLRTPGTVPESGQLRTRAVRGRPLDVMDGLLPAEVAGLGAVLATTVADLHAVGVVHGAIDAHHILVTAEGRPVLSGFADAQMVAPPAGSEAAVDVLALLRTLLALPGTDDGLRRILTRWNGRPPRARALAQTLAGRQGVRLPARGRPGQALAGDLRSA